MRQLTSFWNYAAFLLCSAFSLAGEFPLLTNCFDDAEQLAVVSANDSVQVLYASAAGGARPCYAVSVSKAGRPLKGFLVGADLPAIQRFEADVRRHVPEIPPPPPPPPPTVVAKAVAEAAPEPPPPATLAGLRGQTASGSLIDLDRLPEKNLVVYFWNASDKKSVSAAEAMEGLHAQYASPRKLEFVGIGAARNLQQYQRASEGAEATWPLIYDTAKLAERYHVTAERPILILDRSRNVVAAVANPRDLITQLQKLGAAR